MDETILLKNEKLNAYLEVVKADKDVNCFEYDVYTLMDVNGNAVHGIYNSDGQYESFVEVFGKLSTQDELKQFIEDIIIVDVDNYTISTNRDDVKINTMYELGMWYFNKSNEEDFETADDFF